MSAALRVLGALGRAVATVAAAALGPPRCAGCDARLDAEAVFCAACAASVLRVARAPHVAGVAQVVGFGLYGGALAGAIKRLKYDDRPDVAAPLGELLRTAAHEARLRAALVAPVPLHPERLAERGYNQAALLARALPGDLGATLDAALLARSRAGPPQARRDAAARRSALRGAYRVADPGRVRGRCILLVDDVVTTGATIAACASALHAAGAAEVTALAVAISSSDP